MEKKKIDKSKLLYIGVIAFLCLIFVVGFWYGLDTVLKMEGAYPPVVNEEGLTEPPVSSDEAISHLVTVVDKSIEFKPKTEKSVSFSIDTDSIVCGGQTVIKSSLLYLSDDIESQLESNYDDICVNFGDDFEKEFVYPKITNDDIATFVYDYIYYECPSCGETDTEKHDNCEKCGGVNEYNLKYKDEYEAKIYCNLSAAAKCFEPLTDEQLIKLFGDSYSKFAKINNVNVIYDNLTLSYNINRISDKLTKLNYQSQMTVNLNVTFIGKYKSFGTVDLSFSLEKNTKYDFTWPALLLNNHTMSIEPKATDNLLATLICDDPLKYDVAWTISDKNVATIDNEGYIKGGKNEGKCVVTASYEFQGVTYTDECEVFIGYSVESNSLNTRKLTLDKKGSTAQLSSKVAPAKATIKTVKWYSKNEKIAKVDQNGLVTAVSSGSTQIYALSDDGYFRSTCEVTVK